MTPSAASVHPLVAAYLADLERALAGADPQEREDTLTAIREHIDDALDGAPQDTATATAVLSDLGPVERIAATATPATTQATTQAVALPPATPDWTSSALLACAVASFVVVFTLPWVAAPIAVGTLVAAVLQLRRDAGREGRLRVAAAFSIATLLVAVLLATFLVANPDPEQVPGDISTAQSRVG